MQPFSNPAVESKYSSYGDTTRQNLLYLRELLFDVADSSSEIEAIEETLKWGQPSYLNKSGGTVRIDSFNDQTGEYAIYFHCQSRLVDTFRELYFDCLRFDGNRAIVFRLDDEIPIAEVKHCLSLALRYHRLKHLPLLGA